MIFPSDTSGQRKSGKRQSRIESVNVLFDRVGFFVPENSGDADWFAELRLRAHRRIPGWTSALDAYLHGLVASRLVPNETATEIRKCLHRHELPGWLALPAVLVLAAYVASIAIFTVSCLAVSASSMQFIALFLIMTVGGGWGAAKIQWSNPDRNYLHDLFGRICLAAFLGVVLSFITFFTAYNVVKSAENWSKANFNTDLMAFTADPQGYVMLREFALSNYNAIVIVGDVNDSWASTTLDLPGASPASIGAAPGYCFMNMYRGTFCASCHRRIGRVKPSGRKAS